MNTKLSIHGRTFVVAEHPSIHEIPYGQEGRQGTVYKLIDLDEGHEMALKVFKPSFRHPSIVRLSEQIAAFSEMRGLQVCKREVLSPQQDIELLSTYPELLYAVLMPWIDGITWSDVLLVKNVYSVLQCKDMAQSVATTIATMEQYGIAHTDLYASNIIISNLSDALSGEEESVAIELIDIEGIYASGLDEPENLPEGITGYTPLFMRDYPDWSKYSDRFSGGIIISEMLSWVSDEIRDNAWGDSFFDPTEMHQETPRYFLMHRTLETYYGNEIAGLFARVWGAQQLQQCPTFGEWMVCLSSVQIKTNREPDKLDSMMTEDEDEDDIGQQLAIEIVSYTIEQHLRKARELESQGKLASALWEYGTLIEHVPEQSPMAIEINIAMTMVQDRLESEEPVPVSLKQTIKSKIPQSGNTTKDSQYQLMWYITLIISGIVVLFSVLIYILNSI
ncbi:protein kinase domain-containing protein [Paenibacillus glacialis]|nr:lipopolysaccharide kinase InaA family protein [Paenibacillus glacialis]